MMDRHDDELTPPDGVTLLWCPVCGRNDRLNYLRSTLPHRRPDGKKCPGRPVHVTYIVARVDP